MAIAGAAHASLWMGSWTMTRKIEKRGRSRSTSLQRISQSFWQETMGWPFLALCMLTGNFGFKAISEQRSGETASEVVTIGSLVAFSASHYGRPSRPVEC